MSKKQKIYLAALGVLMVAAVWVSSQKPNPFNRTRTFSSFDKIPYGCYILYQQLGQLFPESEVYRVESPVEEWIFDHALTDYQNLQGHTLLLIGDHTQNLENSWDALIDFLTLGGKVFLSSDNLSGLSGHLDIPTLKLTEPSLQWQADSVREALQLNIRFAYGIAPARVPMPVAEYFFDMEKSEYQTWETLASVQGLGPSFIRKAVGKGCLYLHAHPMAFTNYWLLDQPSREYAASVLSFVPDGTLWWPNPSAQLKPPTPSPYQFVFTHSSLTWAWYLALSGFLLFMIFHAKRRERVMPEWHPPKNSSLEFVKTIGQLYFSYPEPHKLVRRKLQFLQDHLKKKFYITPEELGEPYYQKIAIKTGVSYRQVALVFETGKHLAMGKTVSDEELLIFENRIDRFKECLKTE
jgi:hypothetical protein